MTSEKEPEFYEPGDPDSFGKPPRSPTPEEWAAFLQDARRYKEDPKAFFELLHGQDPMFRAAIDTIAQDRFLSAFPRIEDGVSFILGYLPLMTKEYGIEEPLSESIKDLPFYDEILADLWQGQHRIRVGGMETLYIFLDRPPEEQSYEYIGEMIGWAIRRRFSQDRSLKTQAFFGWVGRHVIKKICPETDFSFERHQIRAAKEQEEMLSRFKQIKEQVRKGVEGELTLEKCYKFFRELDWSIPSILSAGTPLEYRIATGPFGYYGAEVPYSHNSNSFESFYARWERIVTVSQLAKSTYENWKRYYQEFFGDLLSSPEKLAQASREQLLHIWFEIQRTSLLEDTITAIEEINTFETTYFRFIENKPVAEGYAYAQEHIEEVLANLPEIIRLPEEEIHRRFFVGEPPILSDEHDFGYNTGNDIYRERKESPFDTFDAYGNRLPPIPKEDEKWVAEIYYGPNAELYEELKSFDFTGEPWFLGIDPLFFGVSFSDRFAEAYFGGTLKEFYQTLGERSLLERERERIEELREGHFSLPQTPEDLLKNADFQIQRLQAMLQTSELKLRIETLGEVRQIIQELIDKGFLKEV